MAGFRRRRSRSAPSMAKVMADLFQALMPHVDAADMATQKSITNPRRAIKACDCRSSQCRQIDADQQDCWVKIGLVTGPEAGITRDSIDIDWVWHDPNPAEPELAVRPVRLIDTAGMRKRATVQEKLEKLSVADARRAIDFAEVVVLVARCDNGAGTAGSENCRPCGRRKAGR